LLASLCFNKAAESGALRHPVLAWRIRQQTGRLHGAAGG